MARVNVFLTTDYTDGYGLTDPDLLSVQMPDGRCGAGMRWRVSGSPGPVWVSGAQPSSMGLVSQSAQDDRNPRKNPSQSESLIWHVIRGQKTGASPAASTPPHLELPRRGGRRIALRCASMYLPRRSEVCGGKTDAVSRIVPATQERLARQVLDARNEHQLPVMLVERNIADLKVELGERRSEVDLAVVAPWATLASGR